MSRINTGELTEQERLAILNEAQKAPANIPQMKLDKFARHRTESFAESQKTPAQKVQHRLTTVQAKGDTNYPKVKYHPHKDHIVVKSAEDEAERAPADAGWVDHPSEFPPSAVRALANDEKLAMFDQIAEILGVQEGESPVDALLAFRDQFNEYARKLADTAAEPEVKKKGK